MTRLPLLILAGEEAAKLFGEQARVADVRADEEEGLVRHLEVEVVAVAPALLAALPVVV